jgi:hypothetical protein
MIFVDSKHLPNAEKAACHGDVLATENIPTKTAAPKRTAAYYFTKTKLLFIHFDYLVQVIICIMNQIETIYQSTHINLKFGTRHLGLIDDSAG